MVKPSLWSLVLIVSVTTAALLPCLKVEAVTGNPWGKVAMSVLIYNELPGVLSVQCKCNKCHNMSIALEQQHLPWRNGYYFTFKMSTWGDSYVWCKMTYGRLWNGFKVWTGPGFWGQRRMPCQQCVVDVRTDGFYQGQDGIPESLVFVKPWMHVD